MIQQYALEYIFINFYFLYPLPESLLGDYIRAAYCILELSISHIFFNILFIIRAYCILHVIFIHLLVPLLGIKESRTDSRNVKEHWNIKSFYY